MISIEVEIPETLISAKIPRKLRIKWDKIDKQHFQELVSLDIGVLKDVHNSDDLVTNLYDILVKSAVKAYPRKGTKGKSKSKRDWTPEMTEIVKNGKFYDWKWKTEDGKSNKTSQNYCLMREHKRKLRSAQRRLAAEKRDNTYSKIMELNERSDKQFFALVNRRRNVHSTSTSILKFDNIIYNTSESILHVWTDYFSELATPTNSQQFDNNFFSMVNDDIETLTEHFISNRQKIHEISKKK